MRRLLRRVWWSCGDVLKTQSGVFKVEDVGKLGNACSLWCNRRCVSKDDKLETLVDAKRLLQSINHSATHLCMLHFVKFWRACYAKAPSLPETYFDFLTRSGKPAELKQERLVNAQIAVTTSGNKSWI